MVASVSLRKREKRGGGAEETVVMTVSACVSVQQLSRTITTNEPPASVAIPVGELNPAAEPTPSATLGELVPATVDTMPVDVFTRRRALFWLSTCQRIGERVTRSFVIEACGVVGLTIKTDVPAASIATPLGQLNDPESGDPSANPALSGDPARVITLPDAMSMRRIAWL